MDIAKALGLGLGTGWDKFSLKISANQKIAYLGDPSNSSTPSVVNFEDAFHAVRCDGSRLYVEEDPTVINAATIRFEKLKWEMTLYRIRNGDLVVRTEYLYRTTEFFIYKRLVREVNYFRFASAD